MVEWNDKSEGFKLFVLRLLCENNTGDTFSGPFGGWGEDRGIKVDRKEEKQVIDRLFLVPPVRGCKTTISFSVSYVKIPIPQ